MSAVVKLFFAAVVMVAFAVVILLFWIEAPARKIGAGALNWWRAREARRLKRLELRLGVRPVEKLRGQKR